MAGASLKVFGHPVHVILVHFPAALFPFELVLYIVYLYTGDLAFAQAAFFSMVGGVVAGWAALCTGIVDFIGLYKKKEEAYPLALIHGMLNTIVLFGYTLWALWLFRLYPQLPGAATAHLVGRVCLVVLLIAGNYLGGTLVYKYKTGVKE